MATLSSAVTIERHESRIFNYIYICDLYTFWSLSMVYYWYLWLFLAVILLVVHWCRFMSSRLMNSLKALRALLHTYVAKPYLWSVLSCIDIQHLSGCLPACLLFFRQWNACMRSQTSVKVLGVFCLSFLQRGTHDQRIHKQTLHVVIIRLKARLQPNIGFTLWRVLVVFTRSAITLPIVNRFGWNPEHSWVYWAQWLSLADFGHNLRSSDSWRAAQNLFFR